MNPLIIKWHLDWNKRLGASRVLTRVSLGLPLNTCTSWWLSSSPTTTILPPGSPEESFSLFTFFPTSNTRLVVFQSAKSNPPLSPRISNSPSLLSTIFSHSSLSFLFRLPIHETYLHIVPRVTI